MATKDFNPWLFCTHRLIKVLKFVFPIFSGGSQKLKYCMFANNILKRSTIIFA